MQRTATAALVALLVVGAAVGGMLVGNPLAAGDDDRTVLGTDRGPGVGSDAGGDGDPADRPDSPADGPGDGDPVASTGSDANESGVETFDGPEAFASYVEANRRTDSGFGVGWGVAMGRPAIEPRVQLTAETEAMTDAAVRAGGDGSAGDAAGPRVGTTNVQEGGIDEPDVVKTDGRYFYVSQPEVVRNRGDYAEVAGGTTHVVDTSTPAAPERVAEINASGRMLVVGDTLVTFQGDRLVGFDVSDATDPAREWSRSLNGSVVSARAMDGQVYLVVATGLGPSPTCPVEPVGGTTVPCDGIYRPGSAVPVDATYTALSLDPASGGVTDSVGFVGSRSGSTVYVSADALYVTYTDPLDRAAVTTDALLASETVPDDVKDRLREVRSYDLSTQAMTTEVGVTVREWQHSLSADERESTTEALREEVDAYIESHRREFTSTGIVRVGIAANGSLAVEAQGSVPGRPLNQFSLDEHDGGLRIATTVPGLGLRTGSANDLYTLNATTLERRGAVQGMAEGQRIYAVRYVGERAYLVTFRRVDPFHVVDLSDPTDPTELGVKKLPGFSRYLHPIDENHVLGIGEEDGHVKAVLFDVSDPENPTIDDSRVYDEHWSPVSRTHHAFTIDRRHGVFFLPAGPSGLVVDYTNGTLETRTTVEMQGTRRARYVGDYLYVFGERELVVLDETDWSVAGSLFLPVDRPGEPTE